MERVIEYGGRTLGKVLIGEFGTHVFVAGEGGLEAIAKFFKIGLTEHIRVNDVDQEYHVLLENIQDLDAAYSSMDAFMEREPFEQAKQSGDPFKSGEQNGDPFYIRPKDSR